MGPRLYTEGMIIEAYQSREYKMSSAVDVTNHLEFVQHLSSLDEMPASVGGRNNGWRELTITPITKPSVLLDLFYKSHVRTPCSRHRQIQRIVTTQVSGEKNPAVADGATRRAQRRRRKLRRLRKVYGFPDPDEIGKEFMADADGGDLLQRESRSRGRRVQFDSNGVAGVKDRSGRGSRMSERTGYSDGGEDEDDDEDEFTKLFAWTSQLSLDELDALDGMMLTDGEEPRDRPPSEFLQDNALSQPSEERATEGQIDTACEVLKTDLPTGSQPVDLSSEGQLVQLTEKKEQLTT